jgi:hypothetical protein
MLPQRVLPALRVHLEHGAAQHADVAGGGFVALPTRYDEKKNPGHRAARSWPYKWIFRPRGYRDGRRTSPASSATRAYSGSEAVNAARDKQIEARAIPFRHSFMT